MSEINWHEAIEKWQANPERSGNYYFLYPSEAAELLSEWEAAQATIARQAEVIRGLENSVEGWRRMCGAMAQQPPAYTVIA